MKSVLQIANFKKSVGGISGQVDVLLKELNNELVHTDLFNTRASNFMRIILPLKLFFRSNKYDTFHIHGCSGLGFYPIFIGVLVGVLKRKKIIVTYHGGKLKEFLNRYPRLIILILNKADVLTVPSIYLKNILTNYNIKSLCIPNIIRDDNVSFKERRTISPIIIVTRSLEKVYNISLMLEAYAQIKNKYDNAQLYIVGDGSLKSSLENEVKNKKIKDVVFTGRIDNSLIGEMLNKADIYVNPSTADNMPLSLFEAFACGLPVISTNVGGIPNFIQNNKNGFLIDSKNTHSLVEKIEFILKNQEVVDTITKNAYKTFKNYTWNSLKYKYSDLYNNEY